MELGRKLLDDNSLIGIPMNVHKVPNTNNIRVVYDNALGEFEAVFDGETGKIVST
jgi:hypothetical protein